MLSDRVPTFVEAFHVFGCEWDESGVRWYVDGVEVGSTSVGIEEINDGGPFYMMLSTHVGRDWLGHPISTQEWPTYMDVDWVRVWKRIDGS
jgi:beta-glucanase (GH16 family)